MFSFITVFVYELIWLIDLVVFRYELVDIYDVCFVDCTYTTTGSDYTGTKQNTVTGVRCQSWSVQYPHPHGFTDPDYFPDISVEKANNFCRNPDNRLGTGPWCFTNDPDIEWQSCGIPRCLGKTKWRWHKKMSNDSRYHYHNP